MNVAYKLGVKWRHRAQVAHPCRWTLREDVQHLPLCNGRPVRSIYSSREAGDMPVGVMQNSAAAPLHARTLQGEGSEDARDKPPFLNVYVYKFLYWKIPHDAVNYMTAHCCTYNILDTTRFSKEFVVTRSMLRTVNSTLNDALSGAKVNLEW